jgi:putative tryptophan/tyrosine transport system substrate-binding protein
MRRRDVLLAIALSASGSPLVADAQQSEHIRRITLFPLGAEADPAARGYVRALRESLGKLGWSDGKNIQIDVRWESSDPARMWADVTAALRLAPEVIVSGGTPTTVEVAQRTRTIPIVFVNVGDPIASGLVHSFAQPGGNVTGFAAAESSIGSKWVELLKEMAPRVERLLVIFDPQNPTWKFHVPTIEAASSSLALPVMRVELRSSADIESAIDAFASKPNGGLIALPSPFIQAHRELTIALAAKYSLPAMYGVRTYVASGGLMSYNSDWVDQYRQAAAYVDRILKGEKPSNLPVQEPTKYELAINLKTARALNLVVPLHLQQLADEVIE